MILSDHFISLNVKISAIFRKIAGHYGLSFSQYSIIMSIAPSGITMSQLANKMGIDKSTLTRNINILINKNLVHKEKDVQDLRVYNLLLSDSGEILREKLYMELDQFTSKILNSLDDSLQHEISLLDKLIQKIDSHEII
tara:strand:+ start:201 stop:617 length:417 start_codon:yes stop_codon:yes gene_type:complete